MKLLVATLILVSGLSAQGSIEESLQTLSAVSREGEGNEAASIAWKEVVEGGPNVLPQLLSSTGRGNPVADNWLRIAASVIVRTACDTKRDVPLGAVESFLRDTAQPAAARQLAFDLIRQADANRAEAIVPSLIHDPVQELRRSAVQRLIRAAKEQEGEGAKTAFAEALKAVRDEDQTKTIVANLRKLGIAVDLPRHFGFITKWQVIGPFHNTDQKGFDAVFPPEQEFRPGAIYEGKEQAVQWQSFESTDEYGKLDFNKPYGMQKEVTAYAMAIFESSEDREAELRLGSKNGWKVWLNGDFLFGRDEYHRGQQMDQYKLKARLKKGSNTILVKCCQNEQKEDWTVEWEFQLRVCDSAGTAILPSAPGK